jgi:hypothetical protein
MKNRIGAFELHVSDDPLLGKRVWIYIARSSRLDGLTTIAPQIASHGELKEQVKMLKADLDGLLEKSAHHFQD